jgi:ribonuclease R
MKQAVYQPDNIGHYGLALKAYAHFTSPIRRYPDLVVHRAIKAILASQGQQTSGEYAYENDEADQLGEQCSMTERRADDATREVADWLKCEFMQDHVGSEFSGVVSSVTNFGLFVRLDELQIDGMIHVSTLGNEFFHFDGAKHCLVGEHSHQVYRLGDKLQVQVSSVSLDERRINLVLAGELVQDRYARRRAKPSTSRSTDKPSRKPSVREQLKAGKIPGKSTKSGEQASENRGESRDAKRSSKGNEQGKKPKKGKKTTPKGKLKKANKAALDNPTGAKKSKKTKAKKTRPGKNARKRTKPSAGE